MTHRAAQRPCCLTCHAAVCVMTPPVTCVAVHCKLLVLGVPLSSGSACHACVCACVCVWPHVSNFPAHHMIAHTAGGLFRTELLGSNDPRARTSLSSNMTRARCSTLSMPKLSTYGCSISSLALCKRAPSNAFATKSAWYLNASARQCIR